MPLSWRILASVLSVGALPALVAPACGARTGLAQGRPDGGLDADVPCVIDADCAGDLCLPQRCVEGRCQADAPVLCDDRDDCTEDSCLPETGECHFRELSLDEDEDGFRGPRPGFAPGAPGSCGDDCDDRSPLAFPGGEEICDGVDNDCNGIIDDDAGYTPAGEEPLRISSAALARAVPGGVTWAGDRYGVTYGGKQTKWQNLFQALSANGASLIAETPITLTNSDAFTGPIVWTGSLFGMAWEDHRFGVEQNYEILFNRFGPDGQKLGPDLRVTTEAGFSLHPQLIWNGAEFIVIWDDSSTGQRVLGRRIDIDGRLLGDTTQLTPDNRASEFPQIAEGAQRLGLAFAVADQISPMLGFRTFAADLSAPSELVIVSAEDVGTNIQLVWNGDRFVVTWEQYDAGPKDAVWGALLSEDGAMIGAPRRVTSGAAFARTHALLPLGDRLLLVWADDYDGNYELYSKMLTNELDELSPRRRMTFGSTDSLSPFAAFGPDGDVGVVFFDEQSGSKQVYFTRLLCGASGD
jgi:hypothetical protein